MKKLLLFITTALFYLITTAFCGFYVAKVDADLFNNTSEVILVRKANETVITMKNDYQGKLRDFAMIVPVPEVIKKDQVRIVKASIFNKLNQYSAPRLAEYYDQHPCAYSYEEIVSVRGSRARANAARSRPKPESDLGVSVLEKYAVGEYTILVLSAEQSDGLATWLTQNGYKIPEKASKLLQPYIRNEMKFFVVKVNLKKQAILGGTDLRPIQIRFRAERFGLPIRLGMANAKESQDMIIYALTDQGRVTATNYRTVEIPTNADVPEFIKEEFQPFYKSLFEKAFQAEGEDVVFVEYAWNLDGDNFVKCDPCVTTAPALADLKETGVFWLEKRRKQGPWAGSDYEGKLHITRLHVRYDGAHFPQDLHFQVTPDRSNFQGRYVIRHPAKDDQAMTDCEAAANYYANVVERRKKELITCEKLTDWDLSERFMAYVGPYEVLRKKYNKGEIPFVKEPRTPIGWLLLGMLSVLAIIWRMYVIKQRRAVV